MTVEPAGARNTSPAPSSTRTLAAVAAVRSVNPAGVAQVSTAGIAKAVAAGASLPARLYVSTLHERLIEAPKPPTVLHATTS